MKTLSSFVIFFSVFFNVAYAGGINSNKYFSGNLSNKVVEATEAGESYLVVQTVIDNCSACEKPVITKKLNLKTRTNLLRFIGEVSKTPASYELSALKKLEAGATQNKHYQISIINRKNIKKIYSSQNINASTSEQELTNNLAYYESVIKKQPNSESAWQGLYDTYSRMGELEEADYAMEKVLQLKMNLE